MEPDKGAVLILDAESNASTAILQSLGKAGYRLTLAGSGSEVPGKHSRFCRNYIRYPDPLESRDHFKRWFLQNIRDRPFDAILPVADTTIYPLMELRTEIRLDPVVLPREEAFSLFFDKAQTLDLAKNCGIPFPPTYRFQGNTSPSRIGWQTYPCFIKPTRSKIWLGDRGFKPEAALVRNPKEFERTLERLSPFGDILIQKHVDGEGLGIELFCERGEILLSFAHRRIHEYPLTGGGSTYRVSVPIPGLLYEYASSLVKAAGWDGVAMVEFKVRGEKAYLMEVNGRFWGSLPLSIRSGVDFPKAVVEWKTEKKTPEKTLYRIGVYCRKLKSDTIWMKDNLRADKNDPLLLTRPVLLSALEYFRLLKGTEYWDHAFLNDPIPIAREIAQTLAPLFSTLKKPGKWLTRKMQQNRILDRAKAHSDIVLNTVSPSKILVVCLGNICRSPVAEAFLKRDLPSGAFEIRSCGFIPRPMRKTPDDFRRIASRHGIDLENHRSEVISRPLCQWADLIVIMDRENWLQLEAFDETVLSKTLWLGAFRNSGTVEIADPFHGSPEQMDETISQIEEGSRTLSRRFLQGHGPVIG